MTRRHTRRWGLVQIGHAGPPPPSGPMISTVSQTAGTINGGTVVTVTGSGFAPGTTSTLGSVTYTSGSQITITTNAESAGAFSWNVMVAGQPSASQSFTFLAHPTFTSISPTNGPQTLTTAGVVITAANLPASGTGCPVTATVDGNAVTSVVIGSGNFTCTIPTDTTSGAKNVVVTVDGVNATGGTGAWTYNPPPSEISATAVATTGGTGVVTGLNFVSGCTAVATISGVPTSLSVAFVSSSKINYTLASGTYAAGLWLLTITNPDGQSVADTIFEVSSVTSPQTIFGSDLQAQWIASHAVSSGGFVSKVPDLIQSPTNDLVQATGGIQPTLVAADSRFLMSPKTVQHDGSSQYLQCPAISIGSGHTLYCYAALVLISNTGTGQLILEAGNGQEQMAAFSNTVGIGVNFSLITYAGGSSGAYNVVGVPICLVTGDVTSGTNSHSQAVSINNGTIATGSGNPGGIINTGVIVSVGCGVILTRYSNIAWAEIGLIDRAPTSTELAELVTYLNLTYGVTPEPTFTAMSVGQSLTANSYARITGTGFMPGVTVTLSGGVGLVTTVAQTSTVIDIQIPSIAAGAYDVTISNTDGQSVTASNAFVVQAGATPATILGPNLECWLEGSVALNGSNVAQWTDLSLLGNHFPQATSANQPGWNAADANYNGFPSISFTGSPHQLVSAAFTAGGIAPTEQTMWCVQKMTNTTGSQCPFSGGTSGQPSVSNISGVPTLRINGSATNQAQWGSSIGTGIHLIVARGNGSGIGINVDNGTEVTATNSMGTSGGAAYYLGSLFNSTAYFNGTIPFFCVSNGASSAQLTAMNTYVQKFGASL